MEVLWFMNVPHAQADVAREKILDNPQVCHLNN